MRSFLTMRYRARIGQGVFPSYKKGIPPKHIIEKAAAIAAYYSQSRNASYTPVSYTFKKYIRKKKGSHPGAVMMEREEVIMVKPYNPNS